MLMKRHQFFYIGFLLICSDNTKKLELGMMDRPILKGSNMARGSVIIFMAHSMMGTGLME